MASPLQEDEGMLREWAPMTDLLKQIPVKAQRGIFTQDLYLTCVDVVPEFIAVGTNLGLVYWYNRRNTDLQRLRCENTSCAITCVKIVSTVDYMVAAGSDLGSVTVFQIPKCHPECIPESLKPKQGKQVERYTISGLHSAAVTAVEWSINGMKLFSGDRNGLVVLTEIDFYMHLSKSAELLDEKYEIVQLSFCHQLLLVSTLYRTIVCHRDDRWKVTQVGQKERKTLGHYGATFCPMSARPQDVVIYASRPGLRLWRADKAGVVQETLIYKTALSGWTAQAALLTPAPHPEPHDRRDLGPLLPWRRGLLVTHAAGRVYVLEPARIGVVCAVDGLRGACDVAVDTDEILVLESGRSLVRLAYAPELPPEVSEAPASLLDKLRDSAIVPAIPVGSLMARLPDLSRDSPEWNPIVTADEAVELPPVVTISVDGFVGLHTEEEDNLPKEGKEVYNQSTWNALHEANNSRAELLERIGEQDFEKIIFKPKAKKKKVWKKKHSASGAESSSDTVSINSVRSTSSDADDANDQPMISEEVPDLLSQLDIRPDLRSPESIERDVADKERILARVLDLDSLCLDHADRGHGEVDESAAPEPDQQPSNESSGPSSEEAVTVEGKLAPEDEQTLNEVLDSMNSVLSYGPPSDSSHLASLELSANDITIPLAANEDAAMSDTWLTYSAPEGVTDLAVCRTYVCCVDSKENVHYSRLEGLGLRWVKLDYKARQVACSLSGSSVWRVTKQTALMLEGPSVRGPFGGEWREVAQGVARVAVADTLAWLVTLNGTVLASTAVGTELVPCPWRVDTISCHNEAVWALTGDGEVIARTGITAARPEGSDWRRVVAPCPVARNVHAAGWVLDERGALYFTPDYANAKPDWWQVLVSEVIFRPRRLRDKLATRVPGDVLLAVSDRAVWMADKMAARVHVNKAGFIGHRWSRVPLQVFVPSTKWQQISAEGVFENKGSLWLLSTAGDLFCSSTTSNRLTTVGLPSDSHIACLSAAPQSLWLLSSTGRIHARQGLTESNLDGLSWRELCLEQIGGVHLTHISCGCDVVWACDRHGDVYMAVGSPHSMATSTFSPVWILVDERTTKKRVFTKVFAGPHTYMVWAVDHRNNVYVREAIFNDYQLGTDWVQVAGIEATQLSVSESAVWALTPSGSIYRRFGITQNNYIGDYWQKVPGEASAITASVSDGLWAVSKSNVLLRHEQLAVRLAEGAASVKPCNSRGCDAMDDWEVI